jgi:hypothetical protein
VIRGAALFPSNPHIKEREIAVGLKTGWTALFRVSLDLYLTAGCLMLRELELSRHFVANQSNLGLIRTFHVTMHHLRKLISSMSLSLGSTRDARREKGMDFDCTTNPFEPANNDELQKFTLNTNSQDAFKASSSLSPAAKTTAQTLIFVGAVCLRTLRICNIRFMGLSLSGWIVFPDWICFSVLIGMLAIQLVHSVDKWSGDR